MSTTIQQIIPAEPPTHHIIPRYRRHPKRVIPAKKTHNLISDTLDLLNRKTIDQPVPQGVRQFKPKGVDPEIQTFVADRYSAAIPAAGSFFPIGSPRVDKNIMSFNRRDRVKVFYQALIDYYGNNPASNGNQVIDTIADFMVGVENIAFTKSDTQPPQAPLGQEFRVDPKFMMVRHQGAKMWGFKWENGELRRFNPIEETDPTLYRRTGRWGGQTFNLDEQHKDTIRFIPSTGEYTLIAGNGAITVMRPKGDGSKMVPDGGVREKAYSDSQDNILPDLIQLTPILRIPGKDGKDVFGQVLAKPEVASEWQLEKPQKPLNVLT